MGIDIGSTAVRVVAHDSDDGTLLASAVRTLQVHVRRAAHELDVLATWAAMESALDEVSSRLRAGRGSATVETIALACTASTVLVADEHLRPAGRALMWSDHRATGEAREIAASGSPALARMLGHVSPEWGLPKFVRLVRTAPAAGRRGALVLELLDWLNWRISGNLVANAGIREWGWCAGDDGTVDESLLAAVGVRGAAGLMPRAVAVSGEALGHVTPEMARRHPFLAGAKVMMGGMDSYLAALGQGVTQPGRLAMSFGSSSSFVAGTSTGDAARLMYGPMRHILPGPQAYWHGGQTTAGLAVEWFARTFGHDRQELEAAAWSIPAGSDGAVFRETLLDRRGPEPRAPLRGAWDGLTLGQTAAHLYRSALEGICLGARLALRSLNPKEIAVGGGLGGSPLLATILADVLGQPVLRLRHAQTTAFGSAFCADWEKVIDLNPVAEAIEPSGADYDLIFDRYRRLHDLTVTPFGGDEDEAPAA